MKILHKTEKYLWHKAKKAKKSLKRKKIIRRRKKHLLRVLNGKTTLEQKFIKQKVRYDEVKAPINFSLLKNTEETIGFLNRVENLFNQRRMVFIGLKKVEFVDHSAITVLLSLLFKFKVARVGFNGDFPDNLEVMKKIENSQFFEKLMKPLSSGMASDYTMKKDSQIFARANTIVLAEMGEGIMEETSKTIWGRKRVCKGLQRTLIELMHNTNNWASSDEDGQEHWWVSVNHDKENKKVDFYFVDYGQGVLKSISQRTNPKTFVKFLNKAKKMLELGSEPQIIQSLLNGEHRSPEERNHPYFRGKGLPSIRDALDRKQISNLQIITNNTYVDLELNTFSRLSKDFNGTFFHWELNKNNVNDVWKI